MPLLPLISDGYGAFQNAAAPPFRSGTRGSLTLPEDGWDPPLPYDTYNYFLLAKAPTLH